MDQFAANGFQPVDYEGSTVRPQLWLDIAVGSRVEIEWVGAQSSNEQGLALRLRNPAVPGAKGRAGLLQGEAGAGPTFHAWFAGPGVRRTFEVTKLKRGGKLSISNIWMSGDGRLDEWFGNYGLVVTEEDDRARLLRCSSSNFGTPPNFDDLVALVRVTTNEPTPD